MGSAHGKKEGVWGGVNIPYNSTNVGYPELEMEIYDGDGLRARTIR